jgi:molybdopterin converting factor small subunit
MLKFTFDKKTGKTIVQRKTTETKKTTSGKTYVVYDVLGFIERSSIDLTAQQKRYSIAEDVTPQQQYILTHVCADLANVFSTEYVFRTSSRALELTEEERAEVESKVKELSQYYKSTMRAWLKANRDMVNMGLNYAFVNEEPHQMDIDEVLAEQ